MEQNEVIEKLQDRNIKVVAERTGVNYMALLRFSQGKTKKPNYEMMIKIIDYLKG